MRDIDAKLLNDSLVTANKIYDILHREMPDESTATMSLGLFILAVDVSEAANMPHNLLHAAVDVASALLAQANTPKVDPKLALQVNAAMDRILSNLKES